jgi:peroxiredoxin
MLGSCMIAAIKQCLGAVDGVLQRSGSIRGDIAGLAVERTMIPWPWPAPIDDGGALHLHRGMPIPDIALASTGGGEVSLARLPGRTIVFVYPWTGRPGLSNPPGWDDIPGAHGSTPELEGLRNLTTSFASLDTAVYAMSTQTTSWQRELKDRLRLNFELLSDDGLGLVRALRLPTFETGGVTFLRRLTVSILDGQIDWVFYPVHPPDVHARDVLAWLTDHVGYALEGRINPSAIPGR